MKILYKHYIKPYILIFILFIHYYNTVDGSILSELQEKNLTPSGLSLGLNSTLNNYKYEQAFTNSSLENLQYQLGGGYLFSNHIMGAFASFSIPSQFGNMGANTIYLKQNINNKETQVVSISFNYAKYISKKISFGISIKPTFGLPLFLGFAIEPSLTYNTLFNATSKSGFSFINPTFVITGRNLGYYSSNNDIKPKPSIQLGFSFTLYKINSFNTDLFIETSAKNTFKKYPISSGISLKYKFIAFNIGYYHSFENDLLQGLTLGSYINIPIKNHNIAAHYAILLPTTSINNMIHSISLNYAFDIYDTKPPKVVIKTTKYNFSPNYDGIDDYIIFKLKIIERNDIAKWKVTIKNQQNKIIKTFESHGRSYDPPYNLNIFLKKFLTRNEYIIIPKEIRWDGNMDYDPLEKPTNQLINDINNSNQTMLHNIEPTTIAPEGSYTYSLEVTDIYGNTNVPNIGIFDIILPKKDKTIIKEVSKNIFKPLIITSATELSMTMLTDGFSPNNDKYLDTLPIQLIIPNIKDLIKWQIYIFSENPNQYPNINTLIKKQKLIKIIDGDKNNITTNWAGFNEKQKIVNDGNYYLYFIAEYTNNKTVIAPVYKVMVDTTPPILNINAQHLLFSPDNDSFNNEELPFHLSINDSSNIDSFCLSIFEIQKNQDGTNSKILFKKMQGLNTYPKIIYWNGQNDIGLKVNSTTQYEYILEAKDIFGNTNTTKPKYFKTDVLIFSSKEYLQARVYNIYFDNNNLTNESKKILKDVAKTLSYYQKNYTIKVENHTSEIANDEISLQISEKRAKQTMDYLVKHGINSNRIYFQGVGEANPISLDTSMQKNSYKNNRTELYLFLDN